jgi:hypothetical protein
LERAAELDVITTAIGAARAGTGSVLLIEGAAGIGKTRLLACACEQAAAAGMTVLTARAAGYEDGYAWGVVRQLFEAELKSASPGDDSNSPRDAAALAAMALTRLSPPPDEDSFAVLHGLYWVAADIAHRARCCWPSMTCTGRTRLRSGSSPTWRAGSMGSLCCSRSPSASRVRGPCKQKRLSPGSARSQAR